MEVLACPNWHPLLADPTGERAGKPRKTGRTMVIDKGLGIHAFRDLLETVGNYIDTVKLGFGTSALYPIELLQQKAELAKAYDICFIPGGTFLEIAVQQKVIESFFQTIGKMGFTGIEVSDGSTPVSRELRNELISRGTAQGLTVFSEYGKKLTGSSIDLNELIDTIFEDRHHGVDLVTIEGRDSGVDVGIYNEHGECKEEEFDRITQHIPNMNWILWEAPKKSQQAFLINAIGPQVHLGNIPPEEVMSLEALRRGLRSDTLKLRSECCDYMI